MCNFYRYIICIVFLLATVFSARAAQSEEIAAEKDFDAKEIIFSHIGDAYEWHITTLGNAHITVPLPVIVYSKDKGWNLFMSSKLRHGEYKGFYIAQEGEYAGKLVERSAAGKELRPIDLSLTKNATALIINSSIMVFIVMSVVRWYRKKPLRSVPKGFIGAMEMFVMDINDNLIKPCIGTNYKRYAPFLLTAFFFILINNLMGLLPFFPGGASTTGNIAVTMVLALCTFFIVNLSGNKEYWKEIFWPDVPIWLKAFPLMPAIEFLGVFIKPFALMIRLFANMMAGHAIVLSLICLIFMTVAMGPAVNAGMTVLSVLMNIFVYCLELLVAYIQAYVFTMLSAIFIGLAQAQAHHKPKHSIEIK
ncbi:MAG: F0F1 ATP synthase subunit A [Prevotellaceae bacterium]|jgi:F-type H+-transporting ATPase subunit a|nr:F0F1 ATP synthase subunit A [Prevotellaceae bacterium]